MKFALGFGAAALLYYGWTRGWFNGDSTTATEVVTAGGAGVSMTTGGQAATVYGVGQELGQTVPAGQYMGGNPLLPARSVAPFPITAPTASNPFLGAARARAAAAFKMPPAPAPGMPPSRMLVPVVRGTAAATPIT